MKGNSEGESGKQKEEGYHITPPEGTFTFDGRRAVGQQIAELVARRFRE